MKSKNPKKTSGINIKIELDFNERNNDSYLQGYDGTEYHKNKGGQFTYSWQLLFVRL